MNPTIPLKTAMPVIDAGAEYNQDRQHDHTGETCWCGWLPAPADNVVDLGQFECAVDDDGTCADHNALENAGDHAPGRSVSPAILEFRIRELTGERDELERLLGEAEDRIKGFETVIAHMAAFVDQVNADMIHFTGKDYGQWVTERYAAESEPPALDHPNRQTTPFGDPGAGGQSGNAAA